MHDDTPGGDCGTDNDDDDDDDDEKEKDNPQLDEYQEYNLANTRTLSSQIKPIPQHGIRN